MNGFKNATAKLILSRVTAVKLMTMYRRNQFVKC